MILLPFKISRRTREFIHRVTGAVALFVFLFMATAEICTSLHEWLHGGSIPDDDDCPVVAIATGHVHVAVVQVQAPAPVLVTEITPRVEVKVFVPCQKVLPNDRAPPASCV